MFYTCACTVAANFQAPFNMDLCSYEGNSQVRVMDKHGHPYGNVEM